jgi:hypothetical protein
MSEEAKVILDLSPEVRTLLEQQGVDLYEEIQRELPSARLEMQADPEAPRGSRDVVTVIAVTATLVSALTPIILRILNMITPPDSDQTWTIEDTETRHPDGSTRPPHNMLYVDGQSVVANPLVNVQSDSYTLLEEARVL